MLVLLAAAWTASSGDSGSGSAVFSTSGPYTPCAYTTGTCTGGFVLPFSDPTNSGHWITTACECQYAVDYMVHSKSWTDAVKKMYAFDPTTGYCYAYDDNAPLQCDPVSTGTFLIRGGATPESVCSRRKMMYSSGETCYYNTNDGYMPMTCTTASQTNDITGFVKLSPSQAPILRTCSCSTTEEDITERAVAHYTLTNWGLPSEDMPTSGYVVCDPPPPSNDKNSKMTTGIALAITFGVLAVVGIIVGLIWFKFRKDSGEFYNGFL